MILRRSFASSVKIRSIAFVKDVTELQWCVTLSAAKNNAEVAAVPSLE